MGPISYYVQNRYVDTGEIDITSESIQDGRTCQGTFYFIWTRIHNMARLILV